MLSLQSDTNRKPISAGPTSALRQTEALKILVADEQTLVRELLCSHLGKYLQHIVCGHASDVPSTLAMIESQSWDVVLLDINLGSGRNAFDLLDLLRHSSTSPPVLILTAHPETQFAIRALSAGAKGYLTKDSTTADLINAIQTVAAGKVYASPDTVRAMKESLSMHDTEYLAAAPHNRLSNREFEVLLRLGMGQTVSQVAKELSLSVKTVSSHRSSILSKMQLRSTVDLVRYVLENGLRH